MAKKWSKVMVLVMAVLFLATFALALSQEIPPATSSGVDWATVLAILATGFLGFPVSAITEMLKRTLRKYLGFPDAAWVGYVSSAIACILSSWAVLSQMGKGSLINIGLATFLCWLVANGFYKEQAPSR